MSILNHWAVPYFAGKILGKWVANIREICVFTSMAIDHIGPVVHPAQMS